MSTNVVCATHGVGPETFVTVEFRVVACLIDHKLCAIAEPSMMAKCDKVSWLDKDF